MCTGWNSWIEAAVDAHNYNLLGNVHWLELKSDTLTSTIYYNLLGNVHWLEP